MKKQLLKQKKITCNNIEQALKSKKEFLELLGMGTFGVVFLGVVIAIHLNFTMGVLIAVASALYLLMEVN